MYMRADVFGVVPPYLLLYSCCHGLTRPALPGSLVGGMPTLMRLILGKV